MIDQAARAKMASIIRAYMNDEIGSDDFSDALAAIAGDTKDRTVAMLDRHLWCFYDDLKNHKIVASRVEWNYFHRLLLVLESDAELETYQMRHYSSRQLVAICALVIFVCVALHVGWGAHLLVLSIPFGLISMLLSYWHHRATPNPDATEIALTPFSSLSQLLAVHRRIPHFRKKRYPGYLAKRRIRHPAIGAIMFVQMVLGWGGLWLMFAPVPLLFQTLPESESGMRVRGPQLSEEPKP